jgi:hypothetical protein
MTLSPTTRRVLAHITGRTVTGRFACPLWDMPPSTWQSALDELEHAGYQIAWTYGHVQDDPTVTGGYILRANPALTPETSTTAKESRDENAH